jgi:hypothetical protein
MLRRDGDVPHLPACGKSKMGGLIGEFKSRFAPAFRPWRAGMTAIAAVVIVTAGATFVQTSAAQDRLEDGKEKFRQMATVLQHPRCMNCHTRAEFPRQGDDRHRHAMNVMRGLGDRGAPGLHCSTCHRPVNQRASGVPGAPDWHLAPLRMAWEDLSAGELCRALLDPARGGLKPAEFIPHFQTGLVRWAWSPGTGPRGEMRDVPPIPYEKFLALTRQWIDLGAPCPVS